MKSSRRNTVAGVCAVAAVVASAAVSQAAPSITLGTTTLLPNTAGQAVSVYVTGDAGGTMVQGVNFDASTGRGGPAYGGTVAPAITTVDLQPAGGLFAGANGSPSNDGSAPQAAFYSLALLSGSVTIPNAPTLLARITFDTTGLTGGTYEYRLADVLPDSGFGTFTTDFAGVAATITNGSLTISTPEPASLAALSGVAGLLITRRRR